MLAFAEEWKAKHTPPPPTPEPKPQSETAPHKPYRSDHEPNVWLPLALSLFGLSTLP
jgi:hypothetical protein